MYAVAIGLGWSVMALACGAICQPAEVRREVESFGSSTSPIRVDTDLGEGFLKSMGNPMGSAILVSELVSGELASWIGLKVPPFAIVNDCQIDLTMQRNGARMVPPMFFSRAVDGTPHDGGDTFRPVSGNLATWHCSLFSIHGSAIGIGFLMDKTTLTTCFT